ncbi:MAG: aldolase/citrate lyase family protein [Planctomycetaceae bacterium]
MKVARSMRPNRLRELLNADKPTLGTHAHLSWPTVIELIGHSKQYDYVEFVGEYAPYDLYALENIGRAIDLFDNFSGMMKIEQEPRLQLAIRSIGSGIQNLLFADIRTVEDAEFCVKATRAECPGSDGLHGVGMRRDVGFVLEAGTPAFVKALDDAVVALMMEKIPAIDNMEAIMNVKGVDMVQFGPADYSMNLGLTGQMKHPKVVEAEERMIKTALECGVAPRAEIGSPEQAQRYLDLGVKHFCMGTDVSILYEWFCKNGDGIRKVLDGKAEGASGGSVSREESGYRGG